jgi:hypothetical protein
VVEVIASGLIVIKHRTDPFGKFMNVAVLEGDQIKIVDEGFSRTAECPQPVKSLLGFDTPYRESGQVDVLVQLAASMRAHHRGGALLVVPAGTDLWRESIVTPVLYSVEPPFTELAELVCRQAPSPRATNGRKIFGARWPRLRGSPPWTAPRSSPTSSS